MRKFYLLNSSGTRYALNGENGVYFIDVEGLGAEFDTSYVGGLDVPFFSRNKLSQKQGAITGSLVFKGAAFEAKYKAFADYVLAGDNLRFIYSPDGTNEYQMDVDLRYLTYAEKTWTYIKAGLSLTSLGLWYTEEVMTASDEEEILFSITAGGHIPSAFKVSIAPVNDEVSLDYPGPLISVSGADGAVVDLSGGVFVPSAFASTPLVYSNYYNDSYLANETASGARSSIIEYCKPNNVFGHAAGAYTVTLNVTNTGGMGYAEIINATLTVRKYWRVV